MLNIYTFDHNCFRPYHALLFLKDKSPLMNEIPLDGSPAMKQFITCHTPLKSLQALASDTALPLQQVRVKFNTVDNEMLKFYTNTISSSSVICPHFLKTLYLM